MSIALDRPTCFPVYDSPSFAKAPADDDDVSPRSSSIGRNSAGMDDGDEGEVQSSYKGPLDTMDSLEDSLPTRCSRQGISSFYCGKSKSYANLTDVVPLLSPTKDSCNPDHMYSRKRKNLWEKKPNSQKRPADSNPTQGVDHSASSSSGSNSFEECREQCHYPCDRAVGRKRKVSLLTKPFLSADSTPPPAESGHRPREVL